VNTIHLIIVQMPDDLSSHISNFITQQHRVYEWVTLNMPESITVSLSEVILRHAASLRFEACRVPSTLFDGWYSGLPLRALHMDYALPADNLWPVLVNMNSIQDDRLLGQPFAVCVRFKGEKCFLWANAPESTEEAAFIGYLSYHARVLDEKGIRIYDQGGRALFDRK
jgi:hypothetical protein